MRASDFHSTVDRAAGLVVDAACSARASLQPGLPGPQRRLMQRIVRRLEETQSELFMAREMPFDEPSQVLPMRRQPSGQQLGML